MASAYDARCTQKRRVVVIGPWLVAAALTLYLPSHSSAGEAPGSVELAAKLVGVSSKLLLRAIGIDPSDNDVTPYLPSLENSCNAP